MSLLSFLTGCVHKLELPAITAKKIVYSRGDPLGGTHIEADNVVATDDRVTADRAVWVTKYPSFNVSVTVEGYERTRKAAK
jgi:hypothetical protein